jgi:FADH2 O2-dependent halogenase
MNRISTDVAIIGSSFAGSLLALCLRRLGIDVVLLDRQRHPRIALGESTTPATDLVLRALCDRYDLPRIRPLTMYGSWKRTYPDLRCGPKRGFSYFHQVPHNHFTPHAQHTNELLVTASASDDVSDTNWHRADVDAFFAAEAVAAGAMLLEEATIDSIERSDGWTIDGQHDDHTFELRARFLIDSSGLAAVLPRRLGLRDLSGSMETNTRCIYAHFTGVRRWREMLVEMGGVVADHPYDCDAAALHHILDTGWMWVIPFDGGITSVGLTLDTRHHPRLGSIRPDEEWQPWLARHPSVASQLAAASLTPPFDTLAATDRIQRFWDVPPDAAADGWALLSGTHGFIDAFFSTGIAHSMVGIERIAGAFKVRHDQPEFLRRMREHVELTTCELRLIDRIVAACIATFGRHPDLLASVSMLYFAAATTWEQRRTHGELSKGLLLADDPEFVAIVDACTADLHQLLAGQPTGNDTEEVSCFSDSVAARIAPFNSVGLCDPSVHNMYRYTATPKSGGSPL